MKRVLFTMSIAAGIALNGSVFAQSEHDHGKCATNFMKEMMNPDFAADNQKFNAFVKQLSQMELDKDNSKKIVPVVVHVIHSGVASNNVTDAAIQQMIATVNKNFIKQAANINTLPLRFDTIAASANFEFRLAKRDPLGNCTNGIRRIYSPTKTFDAYDDIGFKKLSYWDRTKYLNIWLVNNITDPTDTQGGTILGYCLFPGSAPALRDGATISSSVIGQQAVVTHEIGHHYNLIHIWGDAECGDDQVDDTPIAKGVNFAWPNNPCATAIKTATCYDTISGDSATVARNKHLRDSVGENYQNFMDYVSNYNCPNMFTKDQVTRMRAALSQYSWRGNVVTESNNVATGVADGTAPCNMAPVAEFWATNPIVCVGSTVNFIDGSFNGTPTSWNWEFEGGTPATSSAQNPDVVYNTPGSYKVKLTSTNAEGSSSKTKNLMITVLDNTYTTPSYGLVEGFEDGWAFSEGKWGIYTDPDLNKAWARTSQASASGFYSIRMNNYENTRTNMSALISPSINMDAISGSNKKMRFKLAYAKRTNEEFAYNPANDNFEAVVDDELIISRSTNCGGNWTQLRKLKGNQLVSAGLNPNKFIPNSSNQWMDVEINLSSTTGSDVRFKFEFKSGSAFGNDLYIDDINIFAASNTNVSIDDIAKEAFEISVYPNPMTNESNIVFQLNNSVNKANIDVVDMLGRTVATLKSGALQAGEQVFKIGREELGASGMYFIRINLDNKMFTEKLIVR
jgi:PKD repeat protein